MRLLDLRSVCRRRKRTRRKKLPAEYLAENVLDRDFKSKRTEREMADRCNRIQIWDRRKGLFVRDSESVRKKTLRVSHWGERIISLWFSKPLTRRSKWRRLESAKVCPVQANAWIMRLWKAFGEFWNPRCTICIILARMISSVTQSLLISIFTTMNDIREGLAVWRLWNSWRLEASKSRNLLAVIPVHLFSLFCLLDREHFRQSVYSFDTVFLWPPVHPWYRGTMSPPPGSPTRFS